MKTRLKNRLNGGLDTLLAFREPGQTFTLAEIAAATGVSKESIRRLENRALRKLRTKLSRPPARTL